MELGNPTADKDLPSARENVGEAEKEALKGNDEENGVLFPMIIMNRHKKIS